MDDRQLTRILSRWGRRLRLVESPRWAARGLAAGLALGLILALAARLVPLLMADQLALIAALAAGVGLAVALAAVWLWPRPRHRLAWTLDRRLGLAERLTTALEIERRVLAPSPTMAAAQWKDTLAAANRVDVRTALPVRVPRWPLLAVAVLGGGLVLSLMLPNPQEAVLLQQAAVRAAIEEQIEELEAVHEEVAGAEALTDEEREALLQALEEAIAALEEGQATPEEAVSALAEAERSLAELQDPELADLRAGLERAAGEMADSDLTRALSEALAQGDYEAAAQELTAFAGPEGEELTREQELELAEELAQAAEAIAETDPELAQQLAEAAQAIEQGDIAEAREAIEEAAGEMARAGAEIEGQEAVEEALAALQEGREEVAQAGGT